MKNQKQFFKKGFTVIELIVVIAIIAVLATVVMINVTNYITKAKNSAIKSSMSSIEKATGQWSAEHNNSYVGFCESEIVSRAEEAITGKQGSTGFFCGDQVSEPSTSYWAVCAYLHDKDNDGNPWGWCIDSNGNKEAVDFETCEDIETYAGSMCR